MLVAQDVTAPVPVDANWFAEMVKTFNEYGTAAVAVASIGGIAYLFKEFRTIAEKRLTDSTQAAKEHRETLERVIPLMERQIGSNEAVKAALEKTLDADKSLNEDVKRISSDVQRLVDRMQRLEDRFYSNETLR